MNRREPWEAFEAHPDPVVEGIRALLTINPVTEHGPASDRTETAVVDAAPVAGGEEPPAPEEPTEERASPIADETRAERIARHTVPPTGNITPNPEKAQTWATQWKEMHSPKHAAFTVPANVPIKRLNPAHPSVQVIIALERQINGRQISFPKE